MGDASKAAAIAPWEDFGCPATDVHSLFRVKRTRRNTLVSSPSDAMLLISGGGGASKTGVPNRVRLLGVGVEADGTAAVPPEGGSPNVVLLHDCSTGRHFPMRVAASPDMRHAASVGDRYVVLYRLQVSNPGAVRPTVTAQAAFAAMQIDYTKGKRLAAGEPVDLAWLLKPAGVDKAAQKRAKEAAAAAAGAGAAAGASASAGAAAAPSSSAAAAPDDNPWGDEVDEGDEARNTTCEVCWSPDGTAIAVGDEKGGVAVWLVAQPRAPAQAGSAGASSASSASAEPMQLLPAPLLVGRFQHPNAAGTAAAPAAGTGARAPQPKTTITSVAWSPLVSLPAAASTAGSSSSSRASSSPEGSVLAAACNDGTVSVWTIPQQALTDAAKRAAAAAAASARSGTTAAPLLSAGSHVVLPPLGSVLVGHEGGPVAKLGPRAKKPDAKSWWYRCLQFVSVQPPAAAAPASGDGIAHIPPPPSITTLRLRALEASMMGFAAVSEWCVAEASPVDAGRFVSSPQPTWKCDGWARVAHQKIAAFSSAPNGSKAVFGTGDGKLLSGSLQGALLPPPAVTLPPPGSDAPPLIAGPGRNARIRFVASPKLHWNVTGVGLVADHDVVVSAGPDAIVKVTPFAGVGRGAGGSPVFAAVLRTLLVLLLLLLLAVAVVAFARPEVVRPLLPPGALLASDTALSALYERTPPAVLEIGVQVAQVLRPLADVIVDVAGAACGAVHASPSALP